jgi:hypothetical protein
MLAPVSPSAHLGQSVAISEDGNTAIVGAPNDAGDAGSAWAFRRTGSTWDSGTRLPVPTGATSAWAGKSVALSADASTAVVGGPNANGGVGAAWVFTRDAGGLWQLASTLTEPASGSQPFFGWSVGVSGNGGLIVVGGTGLGSPYTHGSAWVFKQSGTAWAPEGVLDDPTAAADASQGWSVAISVDGSTAIVGGTGDAGFIGAAWVYTVSGSTWSLQQKLGGFSAPDGMAGTSVAISTDGNVAIVGAPFEGAFGTARVYRRTSGVWNATGDPVVTPDLPPGFSQGSQGSSVSLSGDGQLALVGEASFDFFTNVGRAWFYEAASNGTWPSSGEKLVGSDASLPSPDPAGGQGWSVALSADGNTAIIGAVQYAGGQGSFWIFTRNTAGWVTIAVPCPGLYMLGRSYGFDASVNFNPGTAKPTFSWSLSAGSVGQLSGPTIDGHVVVDMKAINPKALLGPGPFTANLCVDVTMAGKVLHECTPLKIYRPSSTTALLVGVLSLNCETIGPVRSKPQGLINIWSDARHVRTYSQADLGRIEATVKELAAAVKTAKSEAAPTKVARTASAAK